MDEYELIKSLIGENVTREDLKNVDCYVHHKIGLFIPSVGPCQYARRSFHIHPTYMFVITFSLDSIKLKPSIELKKTII